MKKCISEALGTFSLVLFGTGAIIINDLTQGAITHLGIAIAFGLIVTTMIFTFGDISGAHLNPAVTLAFFSLHRLPGRYVVPYITSQLLGAISASAVLLACFPESQTLGQTLPNGSILRTFILELILSGVLMLVILSVSSGSKEKGMMAALAIGATVLMEALVFGPITGASMNPARSLAPALVSNTLTHVWIYCVAPTVGMLMAVKIWLFLKSEHS